MKHGAECKDCKYYVAQRHVSGRADNKRPGQCSYVVLWPKAPMHYAKPSPKPSIAIWHDSNAEGCECFQEA